MGFNAGTLHTKRKWTETKTVGLVNAANREG